MEGIGPGNSGEEDTIVKKKIWGLILCLFFSGAVIGCGGVSSEEESVAKNASASEPEEYAQAKPETTP